MKSLHVRIKRELHINPIGCSAYVYALSLFVVGIVTAHDVRGLLVTECAFNS